MTLDETITELATITPTQCLTKHGLEDCDRFPSLIELERSTPGSEDQEVRQTTRLSNEALAIRSQRAEIGQHRKRMARDLGRTVSLDEAARDWIPKHAATWRARNERSVGSFETPSLR